MLASKLLKLNSSQSVVILFLILILMDKNIKIEAVTIEQLNQAASTMRASCMRKTKITEEQADALKQGVFPEEKSVKCYTHCIFEMLQFIKKGKVVWAPAVVDAFIPDELKDTFMTAYEICLHSADNINDKCETAFTFLKCFHKNNPKYFFA